MASGLLDLSFRLIWHLTGTDYLLQTPPAARKCKVVSHCNLNDGFPQILGLERASFGEASSNRLIGDTASEDCPITVVFDNEPVQGSGPSCDSLAQNSVPCKPG